MRFRAAQNDEVGHDADIQARAAMLGFTNAILIFASFGIGNRLGTAAALPGRP